MDIYETLEVMGPRVVARPLSELDLSNSGLLVLPDTARMPQNRALVEKVGPGDPDSGPIPFAVGDVVFYQKFAGAWIYLAGRERLMLMAEEIQARIPAVMAQIVDHGDDGSKDHLTGEPCQICQGVENEAAKQRLVALREEMRADG